MMEATKVKPSTTDHCALERFSLCLFDACAPDQGGVKVLYIAVILLFLLMMVRAEMTVGGSVEVAARESAGVEEGAGSWEM